MHCNPDMSFRNMTEDEKIAMRNKPNAAQIRKMQEKIVERMIG